MSENKSIWSDEVRMPEFPPLDGDVKTDVLVIGGGIAGLLTAYLLKKRGVETLLVEKNRLCGGTTQNTTAKVTFQHGLIYSRLLKSLGAERAGMYLQANRAAFGKYAELCKGIDCNYEVRDNFIYSLDNRKTLEEEIAALDAIGFRAGFRKRLPLPMKTAGAVCFPEQAQLNPLMLLAHIAGELNILEHTHVLEMQGRTALCTGGRIHAQRVVVATHYPFINKHGGYFVKLYQSRSHVLALQGAQELGGMYLDESGVGLSFRNYGKYLLLGGCAHRTGKKSGGWDELRHLAEVYYPQAEEKYHWAAQDCMSLDGMPYIGEYSGGSKGIYVASGFNKWGMTGAMLSAMLLSDILTDSESEYGELFSPSRSILKPQLFINGAEAAAGLATPSRKRCPHLGCALKWNEEEQSWDCSCHGSRFSRCGRLLNNPANGDIDIKY